MKTRWNSSYLMAEGFMIQRAAVVATFLDSRLQNVEAKRVHADLSDKHVEQTENYVELMRHMYDATVQISSEKRPSISLVLPILHALQKVLATTNEDTKYLQTLKKEISEDLEKRYTDTDVKYFLEEATLLDPRMKKKGYISRTAWDRITDKVTSAIEDGDKKLGSLKVKVEPNRSSQDGNVSTSTCGDDDHVSPYKKPRFDLAILIEDDSDDDLQVIEEHILSAHDRAKMEVNKYKMADAPAKGEDIIAWWAQNLESFPHIT